MLFQQIYPLAMSVPASTVGLSPGSRGYEVGDTVFADKPSTLISQLEQLLTARY
ncbi:MAG TPA: hypothetical protein VFK65_15630 [Candidatus Binatia bacterium]|nr:hypothetical protein [Candidatus Binatia bacterium]